MICSYTNNFQSGASDTFIFNNLSAAKILPGTVCSVSGCYWLTGRTYIKTPKRNCTIPGEASALVCIKIKTKILYHTDINYVFIYCCVIMLFICFCLFFYCMWSVAILGLSIKEACMNPQWSKSLSFHNNNIIVAAQRFSCKCSYCSCRLDNIILPLHTTVSGTPSHSIIIVPSTTAALPSGTSITSFEASLISFSGKN